LIIELLITLIEVSTNAYRCLFFWDISERCWYLL